MDALSKVREYLLIAEQESDVPARILATILAAERGPDLLQTWPTGMLNDGPVETNNPADISGNGEEPWYEGVVGVLSNGVSVYRTLPDGAIAWGRLLKNPPTIMHLPANWIAVANSAPEVALRLFAESNYAASHYNATPENPAGDLINVYNSDVYKPLYTTDVASEAPTPTETTSKTPKRFEIYRIRPSNTLSQIALTYGISVADILDYNDIPNPDFIMPGQQIRLPRY